MKCNVGRTDWAVYSPSAFIRVHLRLAFASRTLIFLSYFSQMASRIQPSMPMNPKMPSARIIPPNLPRKAFVMTTLSRKCVILLAGLSLAVLSGCQTWPMEAGITLPSPHYLRHAPQYFPPSPPYPLPKELSSLEEAQRKANDNQ
jgi:hypothetical protein